MFMQIFTFQDINGISNEFYYRSKALKIIYNIFFGTIERLNFSFYQTVFQIQTQGAFGEFSDFQKLREIVELHLVLKLADKKT